MTLTPTPTNTPTQTPVPAMEGQHNWHYQYDGLDRVVYACSDWNGISCNVPTVHEFHYAYDGAGNATRFDRWNPSTSQVETVLNTYNGANQLTSSCVDANHDGTCAGETQQNYAYDAYGNLTSDGVSNYTYDVANRLISVSAGANTTSYSYNGDGDRVSQTVNSTLTTYVLDTATPLTIVLSETSNGQTSYYWFGLDLLAQSDGSETKYLTYDGLGSVRQVTDSAGSVQYTQTFDPYGNLYISAGTNSTKYAFTGEQQDTNGLLFLRARYYAASSGRFFQVDPSRKEINLFTYSQSNPINFTDRSGHSYCDNQSSVACAISTPSQKDGMATTVPTYSTDDHADIPLTFEPSGSFASLSTNVIPNYNPNMPFQYQVVTPPGLHACGLVDVAAILYNNSGSQAPTPQDVNNKAWEIYKGQVPGVQWHNNTDPSGDTYYADLIEIVKQYGLSTTLYGSVVDSVDIHTFDTQDNFYAAVRDNLRMSNKLIDLVGICGTIALCGDYKANGSTLGNIGAYSAGHWIVITGVSTTNYWNASLDDPRHSPWKWVRIYDPFDNWTEYHPADTLFGYQKGVLIAVGSSR